MIKLGVAHGLKALLESLGVFQDVSIGEKKDYMNMTPVAAIVGGDVATKQKAIPDKWSDLESWLILVYVSYDDQGTGEVERLELCDTLLTLFKEKRALGQVQDVIEQLPQSWKTGYAIIGSTVYLRAELELWVWEEQGVPITG